MKTRTKLFIVAYLVVCTALSGCAHGPMRYKTFGYRKYATVEMTKRAPTCVKPVAAPVGVVCDILVTAVDIPVVLVASVPLVFTRGGPDGAGCMKEPWIGVLMFPFWYPVQVWVVNVWPEKMYQGVFGRETGIFREEAEPTSAGDSSPRAARVSEPPEK
jgi:hypothetical protein